MKKYEAPKVVAFGHVKEIVLSFAEGIGEFGSLIIVSPPNTPR